MKAQIEQIVKVREQLEKIEKPSTYVSSAISALNAARDNLTWHEEAEKKAVEGAAARAPSEPAKAASPAAPTK